MNLKAVHLLVYLPTPCIAITNCAAYSVTDGVTTTTDRGGNEGKRRRRRTHAHGTAVGEQTDLLAVGQYSSNTRSRGSVLHDGREEEVVEVVQTTGQRLKSRRRAHTKGCEPKGGMTDAAGSKVTLQGAGRSRRTVRGGAVSMGRGGRGHGSCEEGRTWRFRKTQ